ncbi:MAG TPA: hypothetical protein DCE11_03510 [Ruminiclostridium sp.]|nr:S-layer homology domain-containing protein [Clostridiaceae bacterium]HAA25175.1 hypothetical protein [Ruminiclostridium sp.]
MDNSVLKDYGIEPDDKVAIEIGETDISFLPPGMQEAFEGRPAREISITVNDEAIQWQSHSSAIEVFIPYELTNMDNKDKLSVWYDDGTTLVPVPSGRYDGSRGGMVFETRHLSKFAVGLYDKTFTDMTNFIWAKDAVEILASKGIIKGTSNTTFSPELDITRADFTILIVRMLGLTGDSEDNFVDVLPDKYYYSEIARAKEFGLVKGVGNNRFNPESKITRQEAAVMIERALTSLGKLTGSGNERILNPFNDKDDISDYAKFSMAILVENKLLLGTNINNLNPRHNILRAETAVLMHRVYNLLYTTGE